MRMHTSDIYSDLQRKLMTAVLRPGDKLKPADLQADYGCSPNTLRDVLLRLSNLGLVRFELQRGFRVQPTSPERRRDVARFRIMLEQEGAAASIRDGGFEWETALTAAHHKLSHIESQIERSDDYTTLMGFWSDAELEFHETLISACGSEMMIETFNRTYCQFRQQMVNEERDFGASYFRSIIAEHQAILNAALARDEVTCRRAIYDHLKRNL
ncbi:GntR family transcriptional regulator [Roseobacteraceae bacterium S113]